MSEQAMDGAGGIVVSCGSCGSKLRVRVDAEGRKGKCPKCGVRVEIRIEPDARQTPPQFQEQQAQHSQHARQPQQSRGTVTFDTPIVPLVAAQQQNPLREAAVTETIASTPMPSRRGISIDVASPLPRAAVSIDPQPQADRDEVTIAAPPKETFLFFPAAGRKPEIRSVPTARRGDASSNARSKGRDAESGLRTGGTTLSLAVIAIAALAVGTAANLAIVRYGGSEMWVVKRSAAAWMVGMMTAAAMMLASPRRASSVRLLAATTAAGSIVAARLCGGPATLGPVDLLFLALAVAGSACGFILGEDSLKPAMREQAAVGAR